MSNTGYIKLKFKVGKRIAELRKELGLSQDKLAKITGFNQPGLCNIENGRSFPSAVFLIKLREKTGVSIDKLIEA